VTGIPVGGKDQYILLLKVHIEAIGTPRLAVQSGGNRQDMMLMEEPDYPFVNHFPST
jgi:hypothetical protein